MEKFQTHKKIVIGILNFGIVLGIGVMFAFYNPAGNVFGSSPHNIVDDDIKAITHVHRAPPVAAPSEVADSQPNDAAASTELPSGTSAEAGPASATAAVQQQASAGGMTAGSTVPDSPSTTVQAPVQPVTDVVHHATNQLPVGRPVTAAVESVTPLR